MGCPLTSSKMKEMWGRADTNAGKQKPIEDRGPSNALAATMVAMI
jgi:hypothetical protein